jgi:hypothetical protein
MACAMALHRHLTTMLSVTPTQTSRSLADASALLTSSSSFFSRYPSRSFHDRGAT